MYTSITARLLLNGHQQPALPRKQQAAAGTCREGWVMARGSVVAAAAARPGRRARRITAAAAAAPGSEYFPSASTVLASSGNK